MITETRPTVLVADFSETSRRAICDQLTGRYQVVEAASFESASALLESSPPDLLLAGNRFPDGTGLELLDLALGYWPPVTFVLMIGAGEEQTAAQALKMGAADYITIGETSTLRLTQTLSNAIARSKAEQSAQQRAKELGVLNAILIALNRELGEEPVLDSIVREVHALMGTDACSIILVDQDSDQMYIRASTRLPVRDMVLPVPSSKSIAGRVVREQKGCITKDVHQDPEWHSLGVDDLIPTPVQSMVTVPLLSGQDAIGVLQLINKRVGPFLTSDLTLMESIAAFASAAINRGHQYVTLQEALDVKSNQASSLAEFVKLILAQLDTLETDLTKDNVGPAVDTIRQHATQLLT